LQPIEDMLEAIAGAAGMQAREVEELLEIPPKPEMGHFALPCFALAKKLRKAPPAIAEELARGVKPGGVIRQAVATGPYLNIFLDPGEYNRRVIEAIAEQGDEYGGGHDGDGKTVCLDFSHPNIAKPFSVGHLPTTMIGNALANLYEALGWKTVRINHLGDWGTQFGKLIVAFRRWGSEEDLGHDAIAHLLALYVRFHAEGEKDPGLEEEARAAFRALEEGDPPNRELWQRFRDLSLDEFMRSYERLGVRFDSFHGEEFHQRRADQLLKQLAAKGLTQKSEGAVIVDLSEDDMPPCLLRKSDEGTLYATRDLAAAIWRKDEYDFDRMLYVVDARQALHFRQVFRVLEMAGYDWVDRMVHVPFGLVNFRGVKMSTRKGHVVLLADVLQRAVDLTNSVIAEKNPDLPDAESIAEKVGVGAVVFAILSVGRIKNTTFSYEQVLDFDGRTGPYVQYTHVRCRGILDKYGQCPPAASHAGALAEEDELLICRRLADLPEMLRRAADDYEPSQIANYVLDLCESFNSYYHTHRVIGDDEAVTAGRICLVDAVRVVIARCLAILGVAAPPRM